MTQPPPDALPEIGTERPTRPTEHALRDERRFLAAWEDRRVPWPSAYLRVRQFRRALASADDAR